jgi:outer membrane biosynthesis protein TonB
MQACTYLNIAAGAFYVALSSFAACGGSQPPASSPSPEPTATAASVDIGSPPSSPAASAPATSAPSLAASPPSTAPAAPDRNMDDIRAVVAGNRDAFRACYDKSLKSHPGIKGRFMMKFVVNPDGAVKSAEADVAKSEIHASDLESCAVGVLKGLKFPPSKKGMESTVNYPFDFNPKGVPPKP